MRKFSVWSLLLVFLTVLLAPEIVFSWNPGPGYGGSVYPVTVKSGPVHHTFQAGPQNAMNPIRADYALQGSVPGSSPAGFSEAGRAPSPLGAMLRSFVMPGWGHYYANPDGWGRGQVHLGAEVVLIAAYLGISRQSYVLEKNMYTHAAVYSGADIRALDRQFELAVGSHRSLSDYNDFQERLRNLDRLFPDEPQYRWEWESDELRREYLDLRGRRDDLDQQLPALAALMVANRLISGISAYGRARSIAEGQASIHLVPGPEGRGFLTVVSIPF